MSKGTKASARKHLAGLNPAIPVFGQKQTDRAPRRFYENVRRSSLFLAVIAGAVTPAADAIFASASAQETNVEMTVLADQIRSQGFACSNPISAERIPAASAAEEPAYLLKCEEGIYQIRLIPDQAAKVIKVE
jgi:NAD-dependent SIR2 family protein deacetylase